MTGLQKQWKLITNYNDVNFFSFFCNLHILRNLLVYNNSNKNEKKKMVKWKADVFWIIVPSLLSGIEKWWRWWWIFITWYEFPNIRVLYIYIILLNAHKSREKINTYTRRISKNPQKFYFFFSSRIYMRFYIL